MMEPETTKATTTPSDAKATTVPPEHISGKFKAVSSRTLSFKDRECTGHSWLNPPEHVEWKKGEGLVVTPKAKTDFWSKPFRDDPAFSTSGHMLSIDIGETTQEWVGLVQFSLEPTILYDQAGLMIYVDDKHWIKAGIEMEEGIPRMSCVVTNEVSDWSYFTHPRTKDVSMRVHSRLYKQGVHQYVCVCFVFCKHKDLFAQFRN